MAKFVDIGLRLSAWLCHLVGKYDYNGVKYSNRHLEKMKTKVCFFPAALQLKYVSWFAKKAIDQGVIFLWSKPEVLTKPENFWSDEFIDTTEVGNLAYASIYHPDYKERQRALRALANYTSWCRTIKKILDDELTGTSARDKI